jgi:hypothetical protein
MPTAQTARVMGISRNTVVAALVQHALSWRRPKPAAMRLLVFRRAQ